LSHFGTEMAKKFFYAGSMGPYIYDDTDQYRSTSYVPGEYREAFITDGQVRIGEAPSHDEHVVRLQDLPEGSLLGSVISVPSSLTVNTSDGQTGTVADVQVFKDGNYLQVEEKVGAASFDFEFNFVDINKIKYVSMDFVYFGSSSHEVVCQIYNYTLASWVVLFHIPDASQFNYRFINFPVADDQDYISSGQAKIRVDHIDNGVGTHYIQIGYVSIVQN